MPIPASPPTVAQLTEALKLLGRPVTVEPGAPPPATSLHLARILVAAAEQHAIRAEHAAVGTNTDPADVEVEAADYQATCWWRAPVGG